MPEKLCIQCIDTLIIGFKFKKQSQIAEFHLRNFIAEKNKNDVQMFKDSLANNFDDYRRMNGYTEENKAEYSETTQHNNNVDEFPETNATVEIVDLGDITQGDSDATSSPSESDSTESFLTEASFTNMFTAKRNDKLHFCLKCNKDFNNKSNLMHHMKTHDDNKPFSCSICDQGFTQNVSLKQHMLIHTELFPFECKFCLRKFRRNITLISHLRRHTKDAPYSCVKCIQRFENKTTLQVRRITHSL